MSLSTPVAVTQQDIEVLKKIGLIPQSNGCPPFSPEKVIHALAVLGLETLRKNAPTLERSRVQVLSTSIGGAVEAEQEQRIAQLPFCLYNHDDFKQVSSEVYELIRNEFSSLTTVAGWKVAKLLGLLYDKSDAAKKPEDLIERFKSGCASTIQLKTLFGHFVNDMKTWDPSDERDQIKAAIEKCLVHLSKRVNT